MRTFKVKQLFLLQAGLALFLGLCLTCFSFIRTAQREAVRMASQSPLNQLQLSLHNYHSYYGTFPPAHVTDENGTPIHSWRVLILPFVEEKSLYEQYDFSEPWNGPNNVRLLNQMPRIFHTASEPNSNCFTNILAFTGENTAFPAPRSRSLSDLHNGAENIALLGEITNSKVPWLSPTDFDLDAGPLEMQQLGVDRLISENAPLKLSAVDWRLPHIVFADSIHAFAVRREIPIEKLQAILSIADDEPITRDQLVNEGYLK